MKLAITGGTGFVGRHLAGRLLRAGHEVVLLSRRPPRPLDPFSVLAGAPARRFSDADVSCPDDRPGPCGEAAAEGNRTAAPDRIEPRQVTVVQADVSDLRALEEAFAGCAAVAHCAGINREIDGQTYRKVHIEGTRNVVRAAQRTGIVKIALVSFLRARAHCGSPYHESKWKSEEIVRASELDYTIQ